MVYNVWWIHNIDNCMARLCNKTRGFQTWIWKVLEHFTFSNRVAQTSGLFTDRVIIYRVTISLTYIMECASQSENQMVSERMKARYIKYVPVHCNLELVCSRNWLSNVVDRSIHTLTIVRQWRSQKGSIISRLMFCENLHSVTYSPAESESSLDTLFSNQPSLEEVEIMILTRMSSTGVRPTCFGTM